MSTDPLDKQFAKRFAALREEDQRRLPIAPAFGLAAESKRRRLTHPWRPAAAAAAAVFVVGAGVVGINMRNDQSDTAMLIAAMPSAWPSETDHLLAVSSSVLPGTNEWPQIFSAPAPIESNPLFETEFDPSKEASEQ